jgi:triphosphoribosyl-dephospho-CoA synthetase
MMKGMLLEIACTPKPGLVDRNNSGANSDMDFSLFCLSSSTISQDFPLFISVGLNPEIPDNKVLQFLRCHGIETEKRMFESTGGINTQKGLIFIFAILGAAAGRLVRNQIPLTSENLSEYTSKLTEGLCQRELYGLNPESSQRRLTKGESLFLKYGVRGIRGEVEYGLPTITGYGLPQLKKSLLRGLSLNDALVETLLRILSVAEDTNVIARSDYDTLKDVVQPSATEALQKGGMSTDAGRKLILAMDDKFITRNINPGGSADLLAASAAIYFLEKIKVR